MQGNSNSRRTWIVAGLMALLALGLAPATVRADRDQVRGGEFHGAVESLPGGTGWVGDWKIDGRTVRVESTTRIEQEHGQPAVGAYVEVKGQRQPDGSIRANTIEVKRKGHRS